MNNHCQQKWSFLYKKSGYQTDLENFIPKLKNTFDNYDNLSEEELKIISRKYYEIWNKTMEIGSAFLHNNLIPVKEDKDIVRYLINSEAITEGNNVFLLYRGMCNLGKNNFIMPKKYYGKKYKDTLIEFGKFFKQRTELEKEYGPDF